MTSPLPLAVVTGATGHVGANVVRALVAAGRRVRVLTHSSTAGLDGLDVERAQGSVLEPSTLREALSGASVVFHCAGRISIDGDREGEVERVNVDGSRNVAEACLHAGVERLIHFSSVQAYHASNGGRLDESAPLALGSHHYAYDASKARAEAAVKEVAAQGLHCVVLNPTAVVGPYDYQPSRMGQALLDLAHRRLPATVAGGCDFVDARDVAGAALMAARHGRSGQSYFLAGSYLALADLARLVEQLTGARRPWLHAPMWLARLGAPLVTAYSHWRNVEPIYTSQSLAALRSHRNLSCARAAEDLGYAPRPFERTLLDTLRWFRDAGMLQTALSDLPEAAT